MKTFFTSIILLFVCYSVSAQRKIAEKLLSNEGDTTRKGSFLVLPAVAYSQETGWNFGIVSLSSFYTNKQDTSTRNSTIAAIAAITTKKQSTFSIKPDIWSAGNRFHYTGELKYKNFPFNFYGVGDETQEADKDVITQKQIKISAEIEKQLKRRVYFGLTGAYENYQYSDKEAGGIYETGQFINDRDGGQIVYIGFSQILDSRNTNIYTTQGSYLKFNYSFAPNFFGGENFTGSLFKFDFRTFKSYSAKTVLGFNFNYQTIQGSKIPFYLLPQLGNDQSMRGYYTGRYRGQNLLALQTELRYRIAARIGLVAFAGTGSVYSNGLLSLEKFKPSYGGGFRYFVDPKRGTTLRLDYAFGEKRMAEKRQKGFYLSVNEAF